MILLVLWMKDHYAKRRTKDDVPTPKIFLCIPASAADAAAVNPRGIKKILANGLIRFVFKGNPVLSNGPSNLLRNPLDCIILDN